MTERLLVVTNAFVPEASETLPDRVLSLIEDTPEIFVVAPELTTRLDSWVSSRDGARAEADVRVRRVVTAMGGGDQGRTGEVGDENQLNAISDALAGFQADAILLVMHSPPFANYHERGLIEQVREKFDLPVSVVVVDGDGCVLRGG